MIFFEIILEFIFFIVSLQKHYFSKKSFKYIALFRDWKIQHFIITGAKFDF